jgi:DNA primase
MSGTRNLAVLAANYHKALPGRIREYLNNRGIPNTLIDFYGLGWNGWRITIPIHSKAGELVFFRLAKDPESGPDEPKMLASRGTYVELYGWSHIRGKPKRVVICEGEFDRLVLEARGFEAVTSTGGAGAFRSEWAKDFAAIPEVYICFDRDQSGRLGTMRVGEIIHHARMIELPREVGSGGDVTDFFVTLGKTQQDFLKLLERAKPISRRAGGTSPQYRHRSSRADSPFRRRVERLKQASLIEEVVGLHVKLRRVGETFTGLCPFHKDRRPSLVVFPKTGTFHCFGCRAGGDVVNFLMLRERLSFRQALDALAKLSSNHGQSGN